MGPSCRRCGAPPADGAVHARRTGVVSRRHHPRSGRSRPEAALRRHQSRPLDGGDADAVRASGNRFYPALAAAGIIPEVPDFADGLSADYRATFIASGLGISNLVNRATARADELSRDELRAGAERLRLNVAVWRPRVVAVVGITAYRDAFDRRKAVSGEQDETLEGAAPLGRAEPERPNAHDTVATLAEAYAEPARAAGVIS